MRRPSGAGRWALLLLAGCASAPEPAQEPQKPREVPFRVSFVGNSEIAGYELRRVIEDLLIDFGKDPEQESAILDAASDLRDHYLSLGFPEADVSWSIARQPSLVVTFDVVEGQRVIVSRVDLRGNTAFESEALLELWSRKLSGVFGLGDPYFVESDLAAFALAIRSRYLDQGYLDVEVEGPAVTRSADGKSATVDLVITEGPRYLLSSVAIADGLAQKMPKLEHGMEGKPFDPLALRTLRLRVREALRDVGYPDPVVRLRLEVDREAKQVAAVIDGEAGTRGRVTEVRIEGNERTVTRIIRRKVELVEGEWFSGKKEEQTIRELYLTGLFTKVEVVREEPSPGELILTVRVQEADAREVAFLVGYGSYERARVGAFFTDRNLFGLGQTFRLATTASTVGYGADATWSEPELFGTDNMLALTTSFERREEPSFTDVSWGATAAVSRRLFAHTLGRVGYGFKDREAHDVDPFLRVIDNDFRSAAAFVELVRDDRDSQIYPTRGHRESVRFEVASESLGGDIDFQRLVAQTNWNFPFADQWVLSLAARTGLIWPGSDDRPLPVQERFYNGGESTVRSFRESGLGPRTAAGNPEGGEFRNVFNAELRFPIFKALKGAVFADAGNVGRSVRGWGLSDLRYAVGAGVRFALPVGPVRLDLGVNPDPEPNERDYALHLTVGLPF